MRFTQILAIIAITLGSILVFKPDLPTSLLKSTSKVTEQVKPDHNQLLTPLLKQISTPAPLRQPKTAHRASDITLTTSGVLTYTNQNRANNGLPALTRNSTLDAAATAKLQDMFDQQYFDHVNPQGKDPGDVVEAAGYDFLTTGENLALGNFASDQVLVQAWMDSPGHRANILGQQYQEIGIAVASGTYEGQTTWIAVQEFGTAATACALPDTSLETKINSLLNTDTTDQSSLARQIDYLNARQDELDQLSQQIKQLQQEGSDLIDQGNAAIQAGNQAANEADEQAAQDHWATGKDLQAQGQTKLDQANQQVATYNQQVQDLTQLQEQYNQQVSLQNQQQQNLTELIDTYNQQVRDYNTCAEQFISNESSTH